MRFQVAFLCLLGARPCFSRGASTERGSPVAGISERVAGFSQQLRLVNEHRQLPPHPEQRQWARFIEPRPVSAVVNSDTGTSPGGEASPGAGGTTQAEQPLPEAYQADDYLIVPHTHTYCEGKSILLAQDVSTVRPILSRPSSFPAEGLDLVREVRRTRRKPDNSALPRQNAHFFLPDGPTLSRNRCPPASRQMSSRGREPAGRRLRPSVTCESCSPVFLGTVGVRHTLTGSLRIPHAVSKSRTRMVEVDAQRRLGAHGQREHNSQSVRPRKSARKTA